MPATEPGDNQPPQPRRKKPLMDFFDPADADEVHKVLDQHIAQLRELGFDSVRIFVTNKDNVGSGGYERNGGQWYASFGWIKEWLERESARNAERMRREMLDDEEGENNE